MQTLLLVSTILCLWITYATGFNCYLCEDMQSSLQVCDEKIQKAHCSTHAKDADRCGIFSFVNASGIRAYGKSCVHQKWCESAQLFCGSVSKKFGRGIKNCSIECCSAEYCNYNSSTVIKVPIEYYDDDGSEDCDWLDAGMSLKVSDFLLGACALYTMAMVK